MDLTEKYRPASFADVVGQGRAMAQITSALFNTRSFNFPSAIARAKQGKAGSAVQLDN